MSSNRGGSRRPDGGASAGFWARIGVRAAGGVSTGRARPDREVAPRRGHEAGLSGSVTATGGGGGLRGLRVEITLHDASPADRTRLQGILDGYLMTSTITP